MKNSQILIFLIDCTLIFQQVKRMQPGRNDPQLEQPARSLQDLQMEINRQIERKFPRAVYYDANNVLQIRPLEQIEDELQNSGRERQGDGRGGNNAAQNIKKSVRATLKAKLKEHFRDFDERYFRGFQLKSQKENYILIFLFLHQYVAEKQLTNALIHEVIEMNKRNIRKYIGHSEARMEERETFHSKNIEELEKYFGFDVDFTNRDRRWEEVEDFIRSLFLKKKANAEQAVEKVLKIINERDSLKNLFLDFQQTQESNMQEWPLLKIQQEDGMVQPDIKNREG